MRKKSVLIAMCLVLLLALVPAYAQTASNAMSVVYHGFAYDTHNGEFRGPVVVRESREQNGIVELSINFRGNRYTGDLDIEQGEFDTYVTVYGKDVIIKKSKNELDLIEVAKFNSGWAGQFVTLNENLAFYVSSEPIDAQEMLKKHVQDKIDNTETIVTLSSQESNEVGIMSSPALATVENSRARLQALGAVDVIFPHTSTYRWRLQTKGVVDGITDVQRVSRTFINPRTNSNLQFGGNQYPNSGNTSISISLTYGFLSVTLNYPTSNTTYSDGQHSASWTKTRALGWHGDVMNYTGNDFDERGHAGRLDIQPKTINLQGTTQVNVMYAEYTVRTSSEFGSFYNTYSIQGNYSIKYH